MLDHGPGGDVPEPLTLELEALDHGAERGREHVLVAGGRVRGVRAGERDAYATDDGDAPDRGSDQHDTSVSARRVECHGHSGEAIGSTRWASTRPSWPAMVTSFRPGSPRRPHERAARSW